MAAKKIAFCELRITKQCIVSPTYRRRIFVKFEHKVGVVMNYFGAELRIFPVRDHLASKPNFWDTLLVRAQLLGPGADPEGLARGRMEAPGVEARAP